MSDDLVVTSDIPFGSAYAYRRGDRIKKDAVDANHWQDYVASAGTKAGREALGLPEPEKTDTTTAAGGKDK